MLRFALPVACLTLAFMGGALAGPMPVLPDLPPLPTDYTPQGAGGFYAGILAGYSHGPTDGIGLAAVVGNTVSASDLLLFLEGQAFVATGGDVAIEGDLRLGFGLTDTLSAFATTGVGYSATTGAFVALGASLDVDVGDSWIFRADYRYNHDLDGGQHRHKVMTGLLHAF